MHTAMHTHDRLGITFSAKGSSWQITYGSYTLSLRESRRGQSINDWESWHHHYRVSFPSSSLHPHSVKENSCSELFPLNYLLPTTLGAEVQAISELIHRSLSIWQICFLSRSFFLPWSLALKTQFCWQYKEFTDTALLANPTSADTA